MSYSTIIMQRRLGYKNFWQGPQRNNPIKELVPYLKHVFLYIFKNDELHCTDFTLFIDLIRSLLKSKLVWIRHAIDALCQENQPFHRVICEQRNSNVHTGSWSWFQLPPKFYQIPSPNVYIIPIHSLWAELIPLLSTPRQQIDCRSTCAKEISGFPRASILRGHQLAIKSRQQKKFTWGHSCRFNSRLA